MVILWILGILLALILLLLLLRVGVVISFGESTTVTAMAGPVRIRILPRPEKKKTEKKKDKEDKIGDKKDKTKTKKTAGKVTWQEIRPAVPIFWAALKKALAMTRRRMRISPLSISVVIGGDDPADAAILIGKAEAVMWSVMPQLEQLLRIPDPHIHLEGDFNGGATRAEGTVGISFLIWDLTVIGFAVGVPVLKWFLRYQKSRRQAAGQAAEEAEARAKAVEQRLEEVKREKQTRKQDETAAPEGTEQGKDD